MTDWPDRATRRELLAQTSAAFIGKV